MRDKEKNREPQISLQNTTNVPLMIRISHKRHRGIDYQQANVGVYLLDPDSEGQGVCPAARRGHFHLNRGPSAPGGVTLATVKAIVPAVSECEKERRSKSPCSSN